MDVLTVDQHKRLWMGSNDAGVEVIDLADRSVSNLISRDGLIGLVRFDGREWVVADRRCRGRFGQ